MKLYPYQENAIQHAVEMLTERNNSLVVAGTGAGKTIMMAATIGKYFNCFRALHRRSPHVLVLVHRTEIHTQNHSKFSLVCPDIATSEITSERKSVHGYIHFGMVQTVVNILPELDKAGSCFDLIVIDEAHHAKASIYEKIIKWNLKANPAAALLGVTATPNRGDKLPLIHLFDNYYQITTKFLIDSHYLVRPRFIDLSPVFYDDKEVEKGHITKHCKDDISGNKLICKLCDDFLANKEPGKSIIFAPSHEMCGKIYDYLKNLGRNPAYIGLGLDNTSRKKELNKFEKGDSQELINVDICTEGYDYPPLRNLVDFDTNGTHGQWIQKVGRVLRTATGKTSCTVVDFGGNVEMYPDGVETDVNLEGAVKKRKGKALTESDLFRQFEGKCSSELLYQDERQYTPYHLPNGFETVNDKDYGIVFVACGNAHDCIIVNEKNFYILFNGNKKEIWEEFSGDFDACVKNGMSYVGEISINERSISNVQIKLLAPEYPTMALNWHGANCCICWKTWKESVKSWKRLDL